MHLKPIITLILLIGVSLSLHAQTKIQGILIDSAYNRVLDAAGVSLFQKGKTSVDKVTLTDRYGKFEITESAIGKPMILEFSLQGYEKVKIEFQLQANEKKDFGRINMNQVTNEIEAIDLIPPVRMNGDTIEFNADAFELDSNAVVEDLLNKLPGIVVWGDGEVTYNGRKVPTILVNGKPFFGSDMAIALQNIDKKAVKKLQVYDKRSEEEKKKDPLDEKMEMNVVMKEGKENMLFGSVGAGAGTKKHFQGHGNINKSTSKTQFTIAYSGNNVNKDLYNIDQLLRNTTFKGIGVNADFDSDFQRQGILTQHVAGGSYQYDFLGTNTVFNKHLIKGDISSKWNNNLNINESTSFLLNPEDKEHNTRSSSSINDNNYQIQQANIKYDRQNNRMESGKRTFNYSANMNLQNSKSDNNSTSNTLYDYQNNQSKNSIENAGSNLNQTLGFNANLNVSTKQEVFMDNKEAKSFFEKLSYSFQIGGNFQNNKDESIKRGEYTNFTDAGLNRLSNRNYDVDFDSRRLNGGFSVSLKSFTFNNYVSYYSTDNNDQVVDLINSSPQVNNSLSHISKYHELVYEPTLSYNKTLKNKYLDGRYYYNLSLTSELKGRFHRNENQSTLDYRNLKQQFNSFIPSLRMSYSYNKLGVYGFNQSIGYNYNEEYAFLNRIRPIYDDINPGYRHYGTDNKLKPTGVHSVSLNGAYYQSKQYATNVFYFANYKYYMDGLTDSIVYSENEQQNYTAQVPNGMHAFNYSLSFKKPFFIKKDHTMSLELNMNGNLGNKFQYIDGNMQEMINISNGLDLKIYYTRLNKFQLAWKNELSAYKRYDKKAEDDKNNYNSITWSSGLAAAYFITKRWVVNTNIDNRSSFSKFQDNHAIIWNANTTYRMLKGNNLEVKVAVYDLLRQNKGFYFNDGVTEFTSGYRNILTQYYMVSLSYMPRKFGK